VTRTSTTSSTTLSSWTGEPGEFRPPLYASPERRLPDGRAYPTMGRLVGRWIERSLVHGEGDALGEPVILEPFQQYILDRIYQYDPATGRLLYNRVLIGVGKGNSKTELAAHIGLAELLGPIAPRSPNVPVSAASWDQANKLFGAARYAIEGDGQEKKGPLAPFFRAGDTILDDEIRRPDRPGKLYRIAAVAGTNDGGLPTCTLGDELHEWEGERRERVWTVMGKGIHKRRVPRELSPKVAAALGIDAIYGALQIGITTAGDTLDSLLGRLFTHGVAVATGEVEDPSFLFLWWQMRVKVRREDQESAQGWDLTVPEERHQAILEANPAAGAFLPVEGLEASYDDPTVPFDDFLRYNGNLFVSHPDAWISEALVDGRRKDPHQVGQPPPKGTPIVVGFDGSNNRDCTGLVGWTLDSDYGFVIDAWEPEDGQPVPRTEVDAAVHRSFATWDVVEFAGDPPGWRSELEAWEAEFGTREIDEKYDRVTGSGRVLRFPTFVYARFGPACAEFKTAFIVGGPTFDGHPMLVRHLKNARRQDTRHGQVIVKDSKNSKHFIDLADAAVIARHRARWHATHRAPRRRRPSGGF
jgi:phage terminase large subunit-like protein